MRLRAALARVYNRQLGYDILLLAVPAALLAGELVRVLTGSPVAREVGVVVAAAIVLDALFVHAPRVGSVTPTGRTLGDVPTGRLEKVRRVDRPRARPLEAIRRDVSP